MTREPPFPWYEEYTLLAGVLRSLRTLLLKAPLEIQEKEKGKGPVTDLDRLVDETLKDALSKQFPGDGWVSEESPEIPGKERVWVVDPIDGTRELVRGIPEWVVSVALFVEGVLAWGTIYHPHTDTLIHGVPFQGAWVGELPRRLLPKPTLEELRIGVSRTDMERGRIPPLPLPLVPVGSIAYKLAKVGTGELDGVISVTRKRLWDIAAGCAIVWGGGGAILDLKSMDLLSTLSLSQRILFPSGFVAAHSRWLGGIARTLLPHLPEGKIR